MIPALQPHRPKVTPKSQASPLLPYRQTRVIQSQTESQPQPQPQTQRKPKPQSQLEAMPPFPPLPQPRASFIPPVIAQTYDSAIRHPVFFTNTLRRPPFPLPDGGGGGVSPVAHGYVVEQSRRGAVSGTAAKL